MQTIIGRNKFSREFIKNFAPLSHPLHPSQEGASPVFIGILTPLHP